eukprot:TRINITY_DN7144_c0_g1_i1.p1 TRINITY_DN7144_c0_g1~~TRINITY_DN7144_c0_g1_i1.p1  ORF type:complete len:3457 (+),score=854.03 TRINITY_DN7144_c0_g1_i1:70-10371(+)
MSQAAGQPALDAEQKYRFTTTDGVSKELVLPSASKISTLLPQIASAFEIACAIQLVTSASEAVNTDSSLGELEATAFGVLTEGFDDLPEVAINGCAFRLPGGVHTFEKMWEVLTQEDILISSVPKDRFNSALWATPDGSLAHAMSSQDKGGFLSQIDEFDHTFFRMSPKEAAACDPQQRLALEVTFEALRDANVTPELLAQRRLGGHKTGVFVGAGSLEHMAMQIENPQDITQHTMAGNTLGNIANRISYCFDWSGPSLACDTACSSSMTALHLAVRSLQCGDCETAVVIGVNTLIGPGPFVGFSQARMLSPTSTSRPFDEKANGFVRAEGCVALVLQRSNLQSEAKSSKIRAIIRGIGINEDGRTQSLTFPSAEAQACLIRQVLLRNKLDPSDVVYMEAHGTGTQVGDKEETRSISSAFEGSITPENPLPVGSVKGNTGHLETASAAASIVKVLLMLEHRKFVPTAGLKKLNPKIDFHGLSLNVQLKTEPFPASLENPLIGINSYGFGGANGHLILAPPPAAAIPETLVSSEAAIEDREQWLEPAACADFTTVPPRQFMVYPYSYHLPDPKALFEPLLKSENLPLSIALNGLKGDFTQKYRGVVVGDAASADFMKNAITLQEKKPTTPPRIGFVFGGQGSHHVRMGVSLYRRFKVFRESINEYNKYYKKYSGISLRDDYNFCGDVPMSEEDLVNVNVQMPCIIGIQVALVEFYRSVGINPVGVLGHSSGEMVAAWAVGVVEMEELCRVVFARASGQQEKMPEGGMAALGLPEDVTRAQFKKMGITDVDIAAVNTDTNVTISGPVPSIEKIVKFSKEAGIFCVVLPIPRAYHSRYTEGLKEGFFAELQSYSPNHPNEGQSFYSTVTCEKMNEKLGVEYWWSNVRRPVQFSKGLKNMAPDVDVIIEIGPHSVLRAFVESNCPELNYVTSLRRSRNPRIDDVQEILRSLGSMFLAGAPVQWKNVQGVPTELVDTPLLPYPWKHGVPLRMGKFKWGPDSKNGPLGGSTAAPVVAESTAAKAATGPAGSLSPQEFGYMKDHIVNGTVAVPGAAFVSLAIELEGKGKGVNSVVDVRFLRFCEWLKPTEPLQLLRLFDRRNFSYEKGGVEYCRGALGRRTLPAALESIGWEAAAERCGITLAMPAVYRALARYSGIAFGPEFRKLEVVKKNNDEFVAVISPASDSLRIIHPTVLDACFQLLGIAMGLHSEACVPTKLDSFILADPAVGVPADQRIKAHLRPTEIRADSWSGDVDLYCNDVRVAAVRGLTLTAIGARAPSDMRVLKPVTQPLSLPAVLPLDAEAITVPASFNHVVDQLSKTGRLLQVLVSASVRSALTIPDTAVVTVVADPSGGSYSDSLLAVIEKATFDIVCCQDMAAWEASTLLLPGGVAVMANGELFVNSQAKSDVVFPRALVFGASIETSVLENTHSTHVRTVSSVEEALSNVRSWGSRVLVHTFESLPVASELIASLLPHLVSARSLAVVFVVPEDHPEAWGFARTARNEFAKLSLYCVDGSSLESMLYHLARTNFQSTEYEMSSEGSVPRLLSLPLKDLSPASAISEALVTPNYRLQIDRPGQLQSLSFHAIDVEKEGLGANEVRVKTKGLALHFKDVMLAMNMLPGFKSVLGLECSGHIEAMGAAALKSSKLKIGDAVLCVSMSAAPSRSTRKSMMGSSVVCDVSEVVAAPENVDLAIASGFLGVMATAYYCLVKQANLQKGQWVLIHSAMGGVGQSALQIAKNAGARIIGSAGSESKRAELLSKFGCEFAIDSHDPSCFYEKIMEYTEGRGVDVVLNSLSGEGLLESVKSLAPLGKFCEIGKADILNDSALGLASLKQNITFYSCHLDLLADTHPNILNDLLVECTSKLESGELTPIDTTVVPFPQAPEVFRKMSQGLHRGKMVLEVEDKPPAKMTPAKSLFSANGCYVFTGATRGIGLQLASWAVHQGARELILTGSSPNLREATKSHLDSLRKEYPSLSIRTQPLDLTNEEAVKELLTSSTTPVKGIFHLATTYEAGTADKVTEESVRRGYVVKADGALLLHSLTMSLKLPLEIFFMASSLAGLYGNPYQAVYAAANARLHGLAKERRALKLPALTMDFPLMLGAGRLSEFENVMELEINAGKGFTPVSVYHLCQVVGILLSSDATPAHVSLDRPRWKSVLSITRHSKLIEHNLGKLVKKVKAASTSRRRKQKQSKSRRRTKTSKQSSSNGSSQSAPPSSSAMSPDEITSQLTEKIAFLLGCSAEDIDHSSPLSDLGIDSLAAVELANWCSSDFGVTIGQTAILNGLTTGGLIEELVASATSPSGTSAQNGAGVEESDAESESESEEASESESESENESEDESSVAASTVTVTSKEAESSVLEKIAFLLGCEPGDIDTSSPLSDLGIDSLAAVELSNWCATDCGVTIGQTDVLNGLTTANVIEKIRSSGGSNAPVKDDSVFTKLKKKTKKKKVKKAKKANALELTQSLPAAQPTIAAPVRISPATTSPSASASRTASVKPLAPPKVSISPSLTITTLGTAVVLDIGRSPLNIQLLTSLLEAISEHVSSASSPISSLVIKGASTGMDLDNLSFGTAEMDEALFLFAKLHEVLDSASVPIINLATGPVRGGGMLFPSHSHVSLAFDDSSYGFPEIRQGALPGIVSVAAQKRLGVSRCKNLSLTGDAFSSQTALSWGFADFVGSKQEVEKELKRLIGRFHSIQTAHPGLLAMASTEVPASSVAQAIVSMGSLHLKTPAHSEKELVKLYYPTEGVAVLELNDPDRANAMDETIARDFADKVEALKADTTLRGVIVQGNGKHFCTGIHPYSFVRALQNTTVLDAAARVYRLYSSFTSIAQLKVPVVAVLHGKVVGGGFALSLNCDYRVSVKDASYNYGNLPRGVCPGLHLSRNLPASLGNAKSMSLYLDDPTLTAVELKEEGLINVVVDTVDEARAVALEKMMAIVAVPSQGVTETLTTMRTTPFDSLLLAEESLGMAKCLVTGGAFTKRTWLKDSNGKAISVAPSTSSPSPSPSVPVASVTKTTASSAVKNGAAHSTAGLDVGIHAIEVYVPDFAVSQTAMEEKYDCKGKYTSGLGQERIAFCGDNEDAVSMSLTAVSRLMERTGVTFDQIGRLEVGTESMNDRSKSIKTNLMQLFVRNGNYNVEGVDCYNACYGGTAALFNSVAWIESSAHSAGKYAIVVAVDIADWDSEHRFMNGAACVAMLVGPHAPLVLEKERFSYFEDEADFYKPINAKDGGHPVMPKGGQHSVSCYERALEGCYKGLKSALDNRNLLSTSDYIAVHSTSVYLIKRAFRAMVKQEYGTSLPLKERTMMYDQKVKPSSTACKVVGSMYTAAVYVNLASLLDSVGTTEMVGKQVLMFSYGSGLASTLYRLRVAAKVTLSPLISTLDSYTEKTPAEFIKICDDFSSALGATSYTPSTTDRKEGNFYLKEIDAHGLRVYERQG